MDPKIIISGFADEIDPQLDVQLKVVKDLGMEYICFRAADGKGVADYTLEEVQEKILPRLKAAGVKVSSLGSPIGKIDIDDEAAYEKQLQQLDTLCRICNLLDARYIRMFSFFLPQDKDPAIYKNEVIDRIGQFLAAAEGSGVELCHENEKGIYGDIAPRCLELHQTFPQLKGVFDPANYIQCGQDTWAGWQMLYPYIKYLHIKDALPDGSIVPSGHGIGNVGKIVAAFREMGGQALSVEPHLTVFEGLAQLEENGDISKIGNFVYQSADAAFDAACNALKNLL